MIYIVISVGLDVLNSMDVNKLAGLFMIVDREALG